jgi:hypothetical protein
LVACYFERVGHVANLFFHWNMTVRFGKSLHLEDYSCNSRLLLQ